MSSISPDPGGLNRSPLEYPANSVTPLRTFIFRRDPIDSQDFKNFKIRDFWINLNNDQVWVLTNKTRTSGTWKKLTPGGSGGILSLTGDIGGSVESNSAGNLNVLGGTGITTTGNPATNTITIDASGNVATEYVSDSGSAFPALNILNIVGGGGGITTSAAGNTVTINNSGSGFTWTLDTSTPIGINTGEGHLANDVGVITYNLPATCIIGDTFIIADSGNGFLIQAGGAQTIRLGNQTTNVLGGGTVSSTSIGDSIEFVCDRTDTSFLALDMIGNLALT